MDVDLLSLHGLGVKKAGGIEEIAKIMGLTSNQVESAFKTAQAEGLIVGARGNFMLTPSGHQHLNESYAVVFKDLRENEALNKSYERFEVINKRLLALFTAWQSVTKAGTSVPNDHSDFEYDNRIFDDLGGIHERSQPIIAAFSKEVPRFALYEERLSDAYDKVLSGQSEYVSGVRIDSYHTIWFELHEDLLRLLGRTREEN
ncbi:MULTISPECIES: hypothetical protein [Acidithrix]|uniref:Uncharacterized protein n=1 Tax=Acidithrix ferrooxidans TaxID=1280514 RepID=A0A0D8HKX8_9ACTN|nr:MULTISPECIES: hypothetical protein [Acidithrix]KJF18665.1 hypothetical protein AXFE_04510 [Acidithrix ferrooxidans]CAG4908066.1 unnamed protein product [Acidithrix sp. C25]